jgi:signal transduction histidine kinase
MTAAAAMTSSPSDQLQRIEELGRIILAYSEVTEKLQQSHEQLVQRVVALKAELGEKSRQLERRERLAALGEMAAGMAHEIRNPLGGIQLYASMLASDVAAMPPSLQLVNKISAGVRRLDALVSQVLQFTREISVTIRESDLAQIVGNAIDLSAPKICQRGVRVVVDGPAHLAVNVDEHLFGQAVLNLVLNAVEAMSEGGTLQVAFAPACAHQGATQFRLMVRDDGPGIQPAILDRIFNPFFTTKETGTGLGLAIVHRVIEAHDGTITATNPPGGGAQFEIRI